jgi:hypothetical protein
MLMRNGAPPGTLGGLVSVVSRHTALIVVAAAVLCVVTVIAAVMAVTLVAMAPKQDRATAIREVAGVLLALLPWAAGRRNQ